MKTRLDVACVNQRLFESREKALRAIMAGEVLLNGRTADKAGMPVRDGDKITLAVPSCPFVSRAGLKLSGALDIFKISPKDRICLDIGVATGGFTDCFLQRGAVKVYAVDVGEGQLHEKIKNNPRTVFIPQTNARYMTEDFFKEKPDLCAVDVSFISLKLILGPVFSSMASSAEAVVLIKPQFELQAKDLRRGIVKDEAARQSVPEDLRSWLAENLPDVREMGLADSPLKGAKGNLEFVWHLRRG